MLINEKVAYLKGIIDTANINIEKPEGRLLIEIVNALELIAFDLSDQGDELSELNDYVEEMDEDLADLEELIYDECDCDCDCDCDIEYDCDCDECDCGCEESCDAPKEEE